ncbi:hypothetical protein LCGC14_2271680 [marine sediment metagenome]|uniref:Uncharacterized protein n=1 Tax=marine sediment metagenome TaxID=412755 RepID=A0A0F9DJ31_9ZZZZ
MKQKLKRLFTKDVSVTKNGNGSQVRLASKEFDSYKTVKVVVYGIIDNKK